MDTVKIKVGDLKPYERNAKKHDDRQIKNVMESIEKFGFVQPIVVDKDNVVIIGHCRLIAAKRLKLKEVPCVMADNLSEDDVKRLRLLDNKLNESEWDYELLSQDIPELDFSDFDVDWGLDDIAEPEAAGQMLEEDLFGDIDKLEKHYGVPYQGNKSRIADILVSILPEGTRLVDLFGGVEQ